jgi:PAS domain-containing protein
MNLNVTTIDETLQAAVRLAGKGSSSLRELDELPAPIYLTDPAGTVTYFNRACIAFAGRTPVVGVDSWCVTWKLFTEEGTFLPHDQCPMAVAIKEKRPVRGVEAIAERPDGTRVRFRPYPTPLIDEEGKLGGALNMLVGLPDRAQIEFLHKQAQRCSRLAASTSDERTATTLATMALEYGEEAQRLERIGAN